MRFGGVNLSHNPAELKIVRKKSVSDGDAVKSDISTVSGRGELFGENCMTDLAALQQLARENKVCVLAMPKLGAHPAVLTGLAIEAGAKKAQIGVEFEFRFAKLDEHPEITYQKTVEALQGESLWDIAYSYKADINDLVRLNPHIEDIRMMRGGEEIRLR